MVAPYYRTILVKQYASTEQDFSVYGCYYLETSAYSDLSEENRENDSARTRVPAHQRADGVALNHPFGRREVGFPRLWEVFGLRWPLGRPSQIPFLLGNRPVFDNELHIGLTI